jgi:hypothetical protein
MQEANFLSKMLNYNACLGCRRLIIILFLWIIIGASPAYGTVFVNETLHLSSPRTSFGSVQIKDKIYFAGGYSHHDYISSNIVDVLTLSNSSWSQLNLTSPRGMITPVVIDPHIYFVGGVQYTNIPHYYKTATGSFSTISNSSIQYTSGPTVRRPTKLAINNTTLTVVGAYSVDFMDIATGQWTYNENLTAIMATLYNTPTFVHHQHVFVMGGYDIKTNEWSSSVWVTMIDSQSEPIEFEFRAPEKQIISSTLDSDLQSVVFQYSDTVTVFHIPTKSWFSRNETNFISAVAHFNRTIVSFSSGYWTLDWRSMEHNFTSINQLTFAFSIANQFVHSEVGGTGEVFIVRDQNLQFLASLASPPSLSEKKFVLSIVANPSVFGAVGSQGFIYMYNATTRAFSVAIPTVNQPLDIFTNGQAIFVSSANVSPPGTFKLVSMSAVVTGMGGARVLSFRPRVLVGDTFIDLVSNATTTTTAADGFSGTRFSSNCVWAQNGTILYVMESNTLDSPPVEAVSLDEIDVYNYVENEWEEPITISPPTNFKGYTQAAAINNALVIFTPQSTSVYDPTTSQWTYETPVPSFNILQHPTFASTPVIDNTAYLRNTDSGITAVTLPDNFDAKSIEDFLTVTRQVVMYEEEILFLAATVDGQYASVFYFNIDENRFQNALLESQSQSDLTLAIYDDFLLAFGTNGTKIDYFYIKNGLWGVEATDNNFLPATVQQVKVVNSSTLLVIAGGYHRNFFFYTDAVFVSALNPTVPVPPVDEPINPSALSPAVEAGSDSNTIVIAVVVPVGVVAIAGALLAVFLTRRNKKRKAQTTTNELENKYGQWFTPFSEIQFGAQIGQGANGQVFEGTWKGTKVALKVSPAQANSGVISELEVMINMRPHPNVIQLFGFSVHPETNSVILIIEFCDGGSLDGILYEPQPEPISFEQKLVWLQGAAKGLNHLHSNNIVHRDVAARNILLHQNEPKLTDFGMSRFVEEDQKGTTRSELGPIRWMSPESLKNKQYSNKSGMSRF